MVPDISPEEQQKVSAQFRTLREELEALYNELATVDGDRSEHELVIKQMSGLDGERRCWQQIGPMMAEKKVKDVLPLLTETRDKLVTAVTSLTQAVEEREKRLAKLQSDYGVREQPSRA